MARSWWNRGRRRDIASLLRAERPEAPPALVDRLVSRIGADRPQRTVTPRPRRGLAHVGALTLVVVVGLASVGGIGYAASAVVNAVQRVKVQAVSVGQQMQAVRLVRSAALDEYGAPAGSVNQVTTTVQTGATGTLTVQSPDTTTQVAITWSATTFSTPVAVHIDPTPPATATSLFGSGNQSISVVVTTPTGEPIHQLAAPLEILFKNPAPGFVPAFSADGITYQSIPLIPGGGTTLPADWPDGYFVGSDGTVHVLTRHVTFFAVLFKANIKVSSTGKKLPAAGSGLFGDPTRNHPGAPILKKVGTGALTPRPAAGSSIVPLTFFVSKQAATYFIIVDPSGKQIMLSRDGSTVRATRLTGKNMKSIHIVVLRPGTIDVGVRTAKPLKAGQTYKLRIAAVDIDGNKTVSFVPFNA